MIAVSRMQNDELVEGKEIEVTLKPMSLTLPITYHSIG